MKHVLTILIFLIAHSVTAQHDSFKFLKKNRKLNRNYKFELNQGNGSMLFYSKPGKETASPGGELLNIYPIKMYGDPRFLNPDLIEVKYNYRKFEMGKMIPNILRPIEGNP